MPKTANRRKIEISWQCSICVAVVSDYSSNSADWPLKNLCDREGYKLKVCIVIRRVFFVHKRRRQQSSVLPFVTFSRISGNHWNAVRVTWWPTIENNSEQFWKEYGALLFNNYCELWPVRDQCSSTNVIVFQMSPNNRIFANLKWLKFHYDEGKPFKNLARFLRLH